ncbi:MAG: efflux transporter outer membrane subunit [Pseudacidovorax sp.]|nr:efflux transporter outer membrane subunit [Pseudacidovorax sp.]
MLGFLLAGCAAGTGRPAPALVVEPPAAWQGEAAAADAQVEEGWWRGFGAAELDALVRQAQAGSEDLGMAAARIDAARARLRIASAVRGPTLDATAEVGREARLGGRAEVDGSVRTVGFAARYEFDLWGRLAASQRQAEQALRASGFDRDTVRLGLTAEVAAAWMRLLGSRERAAIATEGLDNARRLLQLVEARRSAGAAAPLDLALQRGLVAARERELAHRRAQANELDAALAQLLGLTEGRLVATTSPARSQRLQSVRAPSVRAGLPADLLVRRPDIARVEAQLAAADADVQATRAALLPRVVLDGRIGLQGQADGGLLKNPLYNLVVGLTAPVFDGGRLAGEHALAEARRQALRGAYRAAVAAAFTEAQTALHALAGADAQAAAHAIELEQAQRAVALAEVRYRAGAETLLVLLDAQRTLYAAQDLGVQLHEAQLLARVALYRALGGGWRDEEADAGRG